MCFLVQVVGTGIGDLLSFPDLVESNLSDAGSGSGLTRLNCRQILRSLFVSVPDTEIFGAGGNVHESCGAY